MGDSISHINRCNGALLGMFVGDALAMPVHWYYNTVSLRRDYGMVDSYVKPRNPHPESILWRSSFQPSHKRADILHQQRRYWGRRDIHYHQFLKAGENTLNLKLARELLLILNEEKHYDVSSWLNRMIDFLTVPGNHNDTYAEEYLRHFFINYGNGVKAHDCGRKDERHIGGYSLMVPLVIAMSNGGEETEKRALGHLSLTHGGKEMALWGAFIVNLLLGLLSGNTLEESFGGAAEKSAGKKTIDEFKRLADYPDEMVVCKHFSSACYVNLAVPATFYLLVKYRENPKQALIANTMCGGDNCGRGAILGALLGAMHGLDGWPAEWVEGLRDPPPLLK